MENHTPLDSAFTSIVILCSCDIPIWCFSEKKWQYGFDPAKEVPVWHTVPYVPLSVPALTFSITRSNEISLHMPVRSSLVLAEVFAIHQSGFYIADRPNLTDDAGRQRTLRQVDRRPVLQIRHI